MTKEHSVASAGDVKLPLDIMETEKNANTRFRGHKTDTIDVKPAVPDDYKAEDIKLYSWKEVALILDRCFMYLFIFLTVITTVVCLTVLATK